MRARSLGQLCRDLGSAWVLTHDRELQFAALQKHGRRFGRWWRHLTARSA